MKSTATPSPQRVPSAATRAEAAVWVARLHGPNRTPEVEAGFRQWLSEDTERAAAFELLTDTWEKSARLRRRPSEVIGSIERLGFRLSFSRAALATLVIAVAAGIGTALFLHTDGFETRVGEQRTLNLEDGTRIYLNTNSRALVHYDKQARRVELEKGEALFEVAKHPGWPFIVTAGDRQVRALGTAFIVRRDAGQLAVTLVEGKVTVSDAESESQQRTGFTTPKVSTKSRPIPEGTRSTKQSGTGGGGAGEVYTLSPGERLTFAAEQPPKLDQPPLDRVTAWQRGQVALDNTPLEDAVAEMNRYSKARLAVEDAAAKTIRVSGIFRAGDSDNFAQAVAKTYGLTVLEKQNEILLTARVPER